MNDRYLYRAKRTDNGEWVEGCLLIIDDSEYRIATSCLQGDVKELLNVCAYEVDPSTVCQYTGLKDKNGKLIWENDVCKCYNSEDKDGIAIIKEDYASWVSGTIRQTEIMTPMFYLKCGEELEVIGNIFDGGSENIVNEQKKIVFINDVLMQLGIENIRTKTENCSMNEEELNG